MGINALIVNAVIIFIEINSSLGSARPKQIAEPAFVFVVGGYGADELRALRNGSRHLGESQHAVKNAARKQLLGVAGVTQ